MLRTGTPARRRMPLPFGRGALRAPAGKKCPLALARRRVCTLARLHDCVQMCYHAPALICTLDNARMFLYPLAASSNQRQGISRHSPSQT